MCHQDISMNNLAYYKDDDGAFVVVILDFDLASTPESRGHPSKHRSGTAPFMAREILLVHPDHSYYHNIYHDLESLFYCLVWHATGYRGKRQLGKGDPLLTWKRGELAHLLEAKNAFIQNIDIMKGILKHADPELRGFIHAIWWRYNSAWQSKRAKAVGFSEIDAIASKARDEAKKSGKMNDEEAADHYHEVFNKLSEESYVDTTLRQGCGISYAEWMSGAGHVVDVKELRCDCCFEYRLHDHA